MRARVTLENKDRTGPEGIDRERLSLILEEDEDEDEYKDKDEKEKELSFVPFEWITTTKVSIFSSL